MSTCAGYNGDVCAYGGDECTCAGLGAMGGPTWRCHTCPSTEPDAGTSCSGNQGATCSYGTTDCSCAGATNSTWTCGTCPSAEPTNGDACTTANIYCAYAGSGCVCTQGAGAGGMTRWRCDAPCPTAQPAPGDACSTPVTMQCPYGATTCICDAGHFFCN
jgi:hypothetical protein